jgi:hypothetical protein
VTLSDELSQVSQKNGIQSEALYGISGLMLSIVDEQVEIQDE